MWVVNRSESSFLKCFNHFFNSIYVQTAFENGLYIVDPKEF